MKNLQSQRKQKLAAKMDKITWQFHSVSEKPYLSVYKTQRCLICFILFSGFIVNPFAKTLVFKF